MSEEIPLDDRVSVHQVHRMDLVGATEIFYAFATVNKGYDIVVELNSYIVIYMSYMALFSLPKDS